MPVGGDVTQFFLGLMSVLTDSLHSGTLPVWTELWGYGFPTLAESQMGVFYPPHLLLYGTQSVENAYVASMLLHTIWGALGAFWFARRLGISPLASTLSAFSWSTCGFFMIHLAHPWGYTTGSWMPWALGLAWTIVAPNAGASAAHSPARLSWARALTLSVILVLQILPGHFQLAFLTHVSIAIMVAWLVIERCMGLETTKSSDRLDQAPAYITLARATAVILAIAAAFPLAAAQLVPTARLARLAATQRDFEYLCGFAATPFHLVNFVAPGLFHRSSLWRPVVWDPFHTSPEENLAYIGVVPLLLAVVAIKNSFRRDPSVRFLTLLAVLTLFLSLGPFVPGFRSLIVVPGFSFFRAPARWSLVCSLALALLAGKGFDNWQANRQTARGLFAFVVLALIWIGLTLGLIELAVSSTSAGPKSAVAVWFDRAFRAMPWTGDPSFDHPDPSFATVMAEARRPASDPRVIPVLAQKNQQNQSFVDERFSLYKNELLEPTALLAAFALLAWLIQGGRLDTHRSRLAFLLLTVIDLWALGRHRLIDIGPLAPLTSQSPLLARLAKEPRGTRSADRFGNLPMIAGAAPISAYRTLDLPALGSVTEMTRPHLSDTRFEPLVQSATRATGLGVRVFDPIQNRVERVLHRTTEPRETIEDPALASWIFGASWTAQQPDWINTFTLWKSKTSPARAWQIALTDSSEPILNGPWSGDPREILTLFDSATRLTATNPTPESWTIEVDGAETDSVVVISQLADPQWNAYWTSPHLTRRLEEKVRPVFYKLNKQKQDEPGAWQSVLVPGKGHWTLHLEYEATDLAQGAAISTVAWVTWLLLLLFGTMKSRSQSQMAALSLATDHPTDRGTP